MSEVEKNNLKGIKKLGFFRRKKDKESGEVVSRLRGDLARNIKNDSVSQVNGSKFLQVPRDLDDEVVINDGVSQINGSKFFQVPRDLDDEVVINDSASQINGSKFFQVPRDLDDEKDYFHVAGDLDDSTTDKNMELIQLLYDKSMEEDRVIRDMNAIKNYLQYRKYSNKGFMYAYDDAWVNNTLLNGAKVLEQTPNGDGGAMISGEEKPLSSEERKYRSIFDYRITIRNSDKITTDEAIAFVNSLIKESKERKLTLRAKNYWEIDAFILYCDQDNLYGTVEMLNDLAHNQKYGELVNRATKHFGDIQPFAGYLDGAYYGITFAHPEGEYGEISKINNSFGNAGMGGTFNGYMDFVLDSVYDNLLKKYGGDTNKITADEMYDGIRKYHSVYMFGNGDIECPLFMNRRNYNDLLKDNRESYKKR